MKILVMQFFCVRFHNKYNLISREFKNDIKKKNNSASILFCVIFLSFTWPLGLINVEDQCSMISKKINVFKRPIHRDFWKYLIRLIASYSLITLLLRLRSVDTDSVVK
jgi:hypothetical protein